MVLVWSLHCKCAFSPLQSSHLSEEFVFNVLKSSFKFWPCVVFFNIPLSSRLGHLFPWTWWVLHCFIRWAKEKKLMSDHSGSSERQYNRYDRWQRSTWLRGLLSRTVIWCLKSQALWSGGKISYMQGMFSYVLLPYSQDIFSCFLQ